MSVYNLLIPFISVLLVRVCESVRVRTCLPVQAAVLVSKGRGGTGVSVWMCVCTCVLKMSLLSSFTVWRVGPGLVLVPLFRQISRMLVAFCACCCFCCCVYFQGAVAQNWNMWMLIQDIVVILNEIIQDPVAHGQDRLKSNMSQCELPWRSNLLRTKLLFDRLFGHQQ